MNTTCQSISCSTVYKFKPTSNRLILMSKLHPNNSPLCPTLAPVAAATETDISANHTIQTAMSKALLIVKMTNLEDMVGKQSEK